MLYKLTTPQGRVHVFHVRACAELFYLELGGRLEQIAAVTA
jgi:hypothetical protein